MSELPQLADLDKLASELADNPLKYAAQAEKHDWDFHLNIDLDAAAKRFQSIPRSTANNEYALNNLEQLYMMYRRVDQGLDPVENPPERQKALVLNGLEIKYANPAGTPESDSEVTQSESDSEQCLDTPRPKSESDPDILRRQSVQALPHTPAIELNHPAPCQFPQSPNTNPVSAKSHYSKQTESQQDLAPIQQPPTENPSELPDPVENDSEPQPTPSSTPLEHLNTVSQAANRLHPEDDLTVEDPSLFAANQPESSSQPPRQIASPALNRAIDEPTPAQPTEQIHPVPQPSLPSAAVSSLPQVTMPASITSNPLTVTRSLRRVSMPARIPTQPDVVATARHANRNWTLSVPAPADVETKSAKSNKRKTSIQFRESIASSHTATSVGDYQNEDKTPLNESCVQPGTSTGAEALHLNVNNVQGVANSPYGREQKDGSKYLAQDNVGEEPDSCIAGAGEVIRESIQTGTRGRNLLFDYPPTISPSSRRASRMSEILLPTPKRCSVNIGLQTQSKKDEMKPDATELRDARRRSSMGLIDRRQSSTNGSPPLGLTDAVRGPNGVYECVVEGRDFQLFVEEFLDAEEGMKGVQCSPAEIDADMDILFAPLFVEPEPVVNKKKKIDVAIQFTGMEDSPDRCDTRPDSRSHDKVTQSFAENSDGDVQTKELDLSQIEMPDEANLSERGESEDGTISKSVTGSPPLDTNHPIRGGESSQPLCLSRNESPGGVILSETGGSQDDSIPGRLRTSPVQDDAQPLQSNECSEPQFVLQNELAREGNFSERGDSQDDPISKGVTTPPMHDVAQSLQNSESNKRRCSRCAARIKGKRKSYFSDNVEDEISEQSKDKYVRVSERKSSKPFPFKSRRSGRISQRPPGRATSQTKPAVGSRRSKRLSNKQSLHHSSGEHSGPKNVVASGSRMKSKIPPKREVRSRESVPFVVVVEPGDDDIVVEAVENSSKNCPSVSDQLGEELSHGRASGRHGRSTRVGEAEEAEQEALQQHSENGGRGNNSFCNENDQQDRDLGCGDGEVPLMDEDDDVPPLAKVTPESAVIPNEPYESDGDDFEEDAIDEAVKELPSHSGDGEVLDSVARVLDMEMRLDPEPRSTVFISGGVDVEPEEEVRENCPKPKRKAGKRTREGNGRRGPSKARKMTPNTQRQTRSKREMKRLGLWSLAVPAEAVLSEDSGCEEDQPRRSKRRKFPPLQYWKNEKKVYERRRSQLLPTVSQVVVAVGGAAEAESELSLEALKARRVVASRR